MRISDWSSDVCSSDLERLPLHARRAALGAADGQLPLLMHPEAPMLLHVPAILDAAQAAQFRKALDGGQWIDGKATVGVPDAQVQRHAELADRAPRARELQLGRAPWREKVCYNV